MAYVYRAGLVSRLCPVEISLTRRIITPIVGVLAHTRQLSWTPHQTTNLGVRSSNLFGRASKIK
jgi:hypothetical protein